MRELGAAELEAYFRFYNEQRPYQVLGYRTSAEVFHGDQAVREEELYGKDVFAGT